MSDLTKPPPYYYIACIDEAGDPGIRRVRPLDAVGGTEWLVLGATLMRASREHEPVQWVREILDYIGLKRQSGLHFRELLEWRKPLVCSRTAQLPISIFALISNKKTMRGHRNPRAAVTSGNLSSDQIFYNYCARLLLERVTDCCYRHSMRTCGQPRHVKIIFSERGRHYYGRAISYFQTLKTQSRNETTFLTKRTINWHVIDSRLITAEPHQSHAGVQLADVVASSFYQAVDILPPTKWDVANARLLEPRVAKESGFYVDYGVAFQPTPYHRAKLLPRQKLIFEHYGYDGRDF